MKKENLAVKIIFLAVAVVLFFASKASAAENELRFEGIRDTTIEAKSKFSTISGIKAYDENGNSKGYSVYYKGKKISSTNYIRTNKVTKKGQYHLLRYELKSNGKVKNVHRKVYVKDRTAPKFSGVSNISINYGSKFSTIKNVSARDNIDGKRGYSVYIAKNKRWYKVGKKKYVNTRKAGKYYLKYVVKDKSGNTTTKRRTVTVKSKIVKTKKIVKKTKTAPFTNTVHIYPRRNDERGWWYINNDQSRLFVHSAHGENMANIRVNSRLVVHVNNTTYEYRIYDRFLMYGPQYVYPKTPRGLEFKFSSRGNKSAMTAINGADLYLQTCWGDDARVLIALAKPVNSSKTLKTVSSVYVSNPQ